MTKIDASAYELTERVVAINRVSKTVKGGRTSRFSALVVVGDENGHVGYGMGKAAEVTLAIEKATSAAKKHVVTVDLHGTTIPHEVVGEAGGGRVVLKPACSGTGVIAGGGIRAVLEMAGVKDVLSKSLGANNHLSMVRSTINALLQLRTKRQICAMRAAEGDVLA